MFPDSLLFSFSISFKLYCIHFEILSQIQTYTKVNTLAHPYTNTPTHKYTCIIITYVRDYHKNPFWILSFPPLLALTLTLFSLLFVWCVVGFRFKCSGFSIRRFPRFSYSSDMNLRESVWARERERERDLKQIALYISHSQGCTPAPRIHHTFIPSYRTETITFRTQGIRWLKRWNDMSRCTEYTGTVPCEHQAQCHASIKNYISQMDAV